MDIAKWDVEDDADDDISWFSAAPKASESDFVVADKVLRMQIEWVIENVHVNAWFWDVMKQIWFSYLTVALPDVIGGVEKAVTRNKRWLTILRQNDFSTLINCPLKHVKSIVQAWEAVEETYDGEQDNTSVTSVLPTNPPHEKLGESLAPLESRKVLKKKVHWFRWGKALHMVPRSAIRASNIHVVPERLIVTRPLALLGLGLMFCNEATLMSDLIRWIRCLQFPYFDPPLAEDSQRIYFNLSPRNDFGLPTYSMIEWQWSILAKLLQLKPKDLPRLPVFDVVVRFLEELNLPRDILPCVMAVADSFNELDYYVTFKVTTSHHDCKRRPSNMEAFVMACIVHSLRVILGLDGVCEGKTSKETKHLQSLMHGKVRLFDFEEWMDYIDYRRLQLFRHTMLLPIYTAENYVSLIEHHSFIEEQKVKPRYWLGNPSADFQTALQNLMMGTGEEELLTLAPNHRPLRSHSQALEKKYPRLGTDFAIHSIAHLLAKTLLLQKYRGISDHDVDSAKGCLGRIAGAQEEAINAMFPLRAHSALGGQKCAVMNNVPSASMRGLIRVCAEMIELPPESLLGEVLFLEMVSFPDNRMCNNTGSGRVQVAKMRGG